MRVPGMVTGQAVASARGSNVHKRLWTSMDAPFLRRSNCPSYGPVGPICIFHTTVHQPANARRFAFCCTISFSIRNRYSGRAIIVDSPVMFLRLTPVVPVSGRPIQCCRGNRRFRDFVVPTRCFVVPFPQQQTTKKHDTIVTSNAHCGISGGVRGAQCERFVFKLVAWGPLPLTGPGR